MFAAPVLCVDAGDFLLTSGVLSGAMIVYAIDLTTGRLSIADRVRVGASPMWVLIAAVAVGESPPHNATRPTVAASL